MRGFAVILAAVALVACSPSVTADDDGSPSALKARVTELEEKLTGIREKVEKLESAQSDLTDAVNEFDDTNWRDVVPKVRSASEDIEAVTSELKGEAAE